MDTVQANPPEPTNSEPEMVDHEPDEPVVPPPITPVPDTSESHSGWKDIASTVLILVSAPLIALFLTAFIFQSYEVDGPSMESTLQNHDRLIVFKTERTWARMTHNPFVPKRGEIIIFNLRSDLDLEGGGNKQLVKRVIGLPGERVVVADGVVTVFNQEHPQGFQPDKTMSYGKVIPITSGNVDLVVPKDQVFVCGDNRPNSLDSRSFGPIQAKDIVGRLGIRLFPLDNAKKF
jgi:signal peptidase I